MESDLISPRVDLCDIRDPAQLADAVLSVFQPGDNAPVPVEEIAHALDIHEIRRAPLRGVEGMLLTNRVRSTGSILVNDAHGREGRARFTIAHELGHFLLEHHAFEREGGFACSETDMRIEQGTSQHARQESEANFFAISLLAPRRRFEALLAAVPDIPAVHRLAGNLEISREAALRRLVDLHPEPLAVVFARNGMISVAPRSSRFPWLRTIKGHPLPIDLPPLGRPGENHTDWWPAPEGSWCDVRQGRILQQAHVSDSGFLTILLRHDRE